MEEKKPLSHIKAGLIIAGLVILASFLMNLAQGAHNIGGGWIAYLTIIVGLVIVINMFGKAMNYNVTFGDLFSYGFKTTAVFAAIFSLFMIVLSFVYPDLKVQTIEAARVAMENQGGDEDNLERGLEFMEKYFWVFAIGSTVLAFVIIGAIGSLIGAAITKKEPKSPFE